MGNFNEHTWGLSPSAVKIVDHVAKYRNAIGVAAYKAPLYLLGAGNTESDAIPLEEEMNG